MNYLIHPLLWLLLSLPLSAQEPTEPTAADTEDATTSSDADTDTPPSAVEKIYTPLPNEQQRSDYIAQYTRDEVIWLETEDERLLALFTANRQGVTQGAALLLHQDGQHADHTLVKYLRQHLPDHGWSTLSLSLPLTAIPFTERPEPEPLNDPCAPPATTDSTETAAVTDDAAAPVEETEQPEDTTDSAEAPASTDCPPSNAEQLAAEDENTDVIAEEINLDDLPPEEPEPVEEEPELLPEPEVPLRSREERIQDRIAQAVSYLVEQGLQNQAIISIGNSSPYIFTYLESSQDSSLQALILINATLTDLAQASAIAQQLQRLPTPILDIRGQDLTPINQHFAQMRQRYPRRDPDNPYHQLNLISSDHTSLLRRIYGWLNRYAAGAELTPSGKRRQRNFFNN